MVVQKFGGTSVADPAAIRRLIEIVRTARTRDGSGPAVVVSAMSGVTDGLLKVVPYSPGSAVFAPGTPRVWSRQPLHLDRYPASYSFRPDGKRAAALIPEVGSEQYSRHHITLWVNALAEFRRRTPSQR